MSPPTLAVVRVLEQSVDQLAVRFGIFVVHKLLDVRGGRRQTDQIEIDASNKLPTFGRTVGRQALRLQSAQNKAVDRARRPIGSLDRWRLHSAHGLKRPELASLLVDRLRDPGVGSHILIDKRFVVRGA